MIAAFARGASAALGQRLLRKAQRAALASAARQRGRASGGHADWYRPGLLWPNFLKD